mmetsp:Transcript_42912/g.62863  ORF Transcript_42912/g.62863 Transcript_42912/m.62863 type:complete len:94 (-) Transcript_42912:473-754(-)
MKSMYSCVSCFFSRSVRLIGHKLSHMSLSEVLDIDGAHELENISVRFIGKDTVISKMFHDEIDKTNLIRWNSELDIFLRKVFVQNSGGTVFNQ